MESKLLIVICMILSIIAICLSTYSISISNSSNTQNVIKTEKITHNSDITDTSSLVGTYRGIWNNNAVSSQSNFNNCDAVIVLFEDSTMIHPNGQRGKWYIENGEVILEYEYTSSYADGEIRTKTNTVKHNCTILEKGLLLGTHFFEKI